MGRFDIVWDSTGDYLLKVTFLGYQDVWRPIGFAVEDSLQMEVRLPLKGNNLQEITVRSARPLLRNEDDKTIVDPQALAASSTSGYEVLEKTPGLFIDQDGNIYLGSMTPASVQINGRELKMSQSDIASMLKSLPPDAIEKIEIVRTPSAKYDASGSGGIVNVVLRKGYKIGLRGSVQAGWQQGKLGNQFLGFNLSNNRGGPSTYIQLNLSRQDNYIRLNTDRQVGIDTLLGQEAYSTQPNLSGYLGYGIAYKLREKWDLSYDGRLSLNQGKGYLDNTNVFIERNGATELGRAFTQMESRLGSTVLNQDLAATLSLDSLGSEWTMGLNYAYSRAHTEQDILTRSALGQLDGMGDLLDDRNNVTLQSDLFWKPAPGWSLETGLKSSFLSFGNNTSFHEQWGGLDIVDSARSNKYRYKEAIQAAYVQASRTQWKFTLKAGLRMENTYMDGQQLFGKDTSFRVQRTDLFPYIYLSRSLMTIAGFDVRAYLVYRKTIARPSYDQLNPSLKYVDQFLSEAGNPLLRPQFSHNYEANISVNEHPLFAMGVNDTRDLFSPVFYQPESGQGLAVRTFDNVGSNKEFYLRGLGAIPPGGRYFFVFGGQYNHNVYNGAYEGKPLSFTSNNWLFFTYHQLKIDKKSMFTMQGFYRLKGALQFYELSSFGSLNLSVNRKFFDDRLTVTVSANDLFFTNRYSFVIAQGNVDATGKREVDSRRFGIHLRYNFGLDKKDENRSSLLPMDPKME